VLFDEQFKYVSNSSGTEQVGADNAFTVHTRSDLPVNKNGYLYVYVSNETTNLDVFFDNLQVTHIHGAIVEETHYYPFGLTMAGISSQAANTTENKYKYNGIELDKDLDLNTYEAFFRELDPQTGRWWQIDPKIESMEMWSPYASNYDNPITYSDPLGDEGESCCTFSGVITWLFNLTTDRQKENAAALGNAAVSTVKQMGANAQARWEAGADPLHQAMANPFSLIEGPVGLEVNAANTLLRTEVKAESQIVKNAAQGAAFEKQTVAAAEKTQTNVVEQVTVKTQSGTKTKIDVVGKDKQTNQIVLTEAKSSQTAPLTKNQKKAFPEIQQTGGTVVGKGKPGVPGGTQIPPTQVKVVRPPEKKE
jgi:RHS repeat-associated protein